MKHTKYYFIDFSISLIFKDSDVRIAGGNNGQDQNPPELETPRYDPFALDVFILGNLYRKSFLQVLITPGHLDVWSPLTSWQNYSNLEFIRPLTESMTQADPKARPTISEALAQFKSIVAAKQGLGLRWRLRPREESGVSRLLWDAVSLTRISLHVVQNVASGKTFRKLREQTKSERS